VHNLDGDGTRQALVKSLIHGSHAASGDSGLDEIPPIHQEAHERVSGRGIHSLKCTQAETYFPLPLP